MPPSPHHAYIYSVSVFINVSNDSRLSYRRHTLMHVMQSYHWNASMYTYVQLEVRTVMRDGSAGASTLPRRV